MPVSRSGTAFLKTMSFRWQPPSLPKSVGTFVRDFVSSKKAGEYARMEGADTVSEEHTRQATETIEKDEILDYYFEQDLSSQQALTYLATTLAFIEPKHEASTKRIYNLYSSIAESSGRRVKSERKIYEFPRPAVDAGTCPVRGKESGSKRRPEIPIRGH